MADSLRASRIGLEIIDRARRQKGWTKTVTVAWWEAALTSRATLKRFWRQAPIQKEVFIQICRVVGINDWSAIAEVVIDLPTEGAEPQAPQGLVPDISGFYGRTTELQLLEQWSLRENCRLIALSGKPGIGKTDLATVFCDNVQDAFAVVQRQSLGQAPTLTTLLTSLRQTFPVDIPAGKDLLAQFMAGLEQVRCLFILDGLEAILQQGSLSGQYRAGYEDYGEWLQRISADRHQSCIVVISREQLREVAILESRLQPYVRSLPLTGLAVADAKKLLQANHLTDVLAWDALIQQYGTSPQILTLIATTIVDLFNGSVAKFLQEAGTLIIPPGVEQVFQQQFDRLSAPEKTVLQQLASADQALAFAPLQTLTAIPKATFPAVLESLKRRSLLERRIATDSDDVLFTLQPVIKKFVQRYSAPQ
jgi:hypothetical protein